MRRGFLGARFLARKGADSHCSGDREKEGMDRSQALVECSQAGVRGGRAAGMDPWVRSRREGEVVWARMGKDYRALLRGMKASKAGGGRQQEPEEGGQQADSWQPPVQLTKREGSAWQRLELLDEVVGCQ
jgi:hypothetical protein